MALSEEKILKIIKENNHITVKIGNRPLLNKLRKLEEQGKIEFADVFKDCQYYRAKGSDWRFYSKDEIEMMDRGIL